MEWILSHMDDADLNDPIPEASAAPEAESFSANSESVVMLSSMGFTERQVLSTNLLYARLSSRAGPFFMPSPTFTLQTWTIAGKDPSIFLSNPWLRAADALILMSVGVKFVSVRVLLQYRPQQH